MKNPAREPALIELDIGQPVWDQFFWLAPLVLVGTLETNGKHDLAPKHMATPMGWENFFGFVCTPRHHTYSNIRRDEVFTVSYPRPEQLVITSLAASPRFEEDEKPALSVLPVIPARKIRGVLVRNAAVHLECELERIVDGFGINSLVVGRIVAARIAQDALRDDEIDDQELIHRSPLLAYLHPGRFATIDQSRSFPFPAGFSK